ncbi:TMEM65, partial [Symbiodinium natans]
MIRLWAWRSAQHWRGSLGRAVPQRSLRPCIALARGFCVHVHHPQEHEPDDVRALKAAAQKLLEEPGLAAKVAKTTAAAEFLDQCEAASADSEQAEAPLPTARQLELYFLHNFIPFIGFGFCDNAIMILAGDYIDAKLGLTLGLSTMAAAAWGNTFSDVIGLWISGFIETFVGSTGLQHHNLTSGQMELLTVRIVKNTSMIAGITLGCILGMFPLIYPEDWRFWPSRHDLE